MLFWICDPDANVQMELKTAMNSVHHRANLWQNLKPQKSAFVYLHTGRSFFGDRCCMIPT